MPTERQYNILLIDEDEERAHAFKQALSESRYKIVHLQSPMQNLLKQVDTIQPDIIVIDIESPSRDILESLHTMSRFAPKPVVMFSDEEDTEVINQSVRSGVSAYIVGDTEPKRVRSILDAAVARFTEFQRLKQELDDTKQALETRRVVDQAKSLLMEQRGLTEKDAYNALRKMAMDAGQRMEDVAKTLISVLTNLDLGGRQ